MWHDERQFYLYTYCHITAVCRSRSPASGSKKKSSKKVKEEATTGAEAEEPEEEEEEAPASPEPQSALANQDSNPASTPKSSRVKEPNGDSQTPVTAGELAADKEVQRLLLWISLFFVS